MTHVSETGAINRLSFTGAGFWYVCHAYLAPGTGFVRYRLENTVLFQARKWRARD